MYDHYLRIFLSIAWLINHFSTSMIGWSRDSWRNAGFSAILMKAWLTDGRTDRRTDVPTDRPSYRDARSHLKTVWNRRMTSIFICLLPMSSGANEWASEWTSERSGGRQHSEHCLPICLPICVCLRITGGFLLLQIRLAGRERYRYRCKTKVNFKQKRISNKSEFQAGFTEFDKCLFNTWNNLKNTDLAIKNAFLS